MKYAALTLLLTLSLLTGFAHNNEPTSTKLISGKVIDRQTGEALAGVEIQVEGSDALCYTDMNGGYILPVNSKDKTCITVKMVGYQPLQINSENIGMEHDLYLKPR